MELPRNVSPTSPTVNLVDTRVTCMNPRAPREYTHSYRVQSLCSIGINTLRSKQNGHLFADGVFKYFIPKYNVFYLNVTEDGSKGSQQQFGSIGSGNGIMPYRW